MTTVFHRVGPFEVIGQIGSGGMAQVFLADDTRNGRRLALKLVRVTDDRQGRDTLEAERWGAKLQGRLSDVCPLVPRVFEDGELPPYYFIAMEFVAGDDLSSVIARGPLSIADAVPVAGQLCRFLECAHALETTIDGVPFRSLVHGDLKPGNIRMSASGEVKVLDFGIAKALSLSRKVTRNEFGSLPYMSPERLDSDVQEVGKPADLWALGVILYELLSGAAPFRAPDTRRLEQQIRAGYRRRPLQDTVPAGLRAITARLLAPAPDDRYESAVAVREDLDAFAAGHPTVAEGRGFCAAPDPGQADETATRRTRPIDAAQRPFDAAQGGPFDAAQGGPFDAAQGRPFDGARDRPAGGDEATRRTRSPDAAQGGSFDATQSRPVDAAQGGPAGGGEATRRTQPADLAQGRPGDAVQGRPFDAAQGRPDAGTPISGADPVKSVAAIAPARARRRPTLRGALLLAAFLVVINEALLGVSARRVAFTASRQDLDGITPLWDDYGRLSGRSLLRIGVVGLETSLRARVLDLSERVMANYRSPLPTVRERQWRAAQVNLQQALALAPHNTRLKAALRYCEGHLHRIDGEAAKGRTQRATASQHFAEAVSAFREAAELRPDWPDPFLGLARTFIYGLEDTDRAADAMRQAQKRGYGIGDRDTAQFGDGYRVRGDSLRQTARQLMHLPQEAEYLQRAIAAYREALAQYEKIPEFPGVTVSLRRVHGAIGDLEKRLADLAAEKDPAIRWADKEPAIRWE